MTQATAEVTPQAHRPGFFATLAKIIFGKR